LRMPDPQPSEFVDASDDIAGAHAGHRAAHAKGTLCAGTFKASRAAADLTRAAHMQGTPVRATVRFSNGGGNPAAPDTAAEGRGMAVKLYIDDDTRTDMVAINLPCFFVRTPADFLDFTRARKPDPATGQPDMQLLGKWLGEHPEAQTAIQAAVTAPPPTSYAQVAYNGIHAFRWLDADGEGRFVRFAWEPEAGIANLDPDDAKTRGPDYLQEEIVSRIAAGRVAFRLVVTLAELGDAVDDPTEQWPADRERVDVGRLEITDRETGRERDGDVLVFDPTRIVDGIELTEDPILRFRSGAYSVSVERRSGVALSTQ
jgi:catalase